MGIMSRNASGEVGTVQRISDADTSVLAKLTILRERAVASAAGNSY